MLSTGGKYFHGGRRSTGKEVAKLSTDTDMALPLLYYYPVIIIIELLVWLKIIRIVARKIQLGKGAKKRKKANKC